MIRPRRPGRRRAAPAVVCVATVLATTVIVVLASTAARAADEPQGPRDDEDVSNQVSSDRCPPPRSTRDTAVIVTTMPPMPEFEFELDGRAYETDRAGRAQLVTQQTCGLLDRLEASGAPIELDEGVRARFSRWYFTKGSGTSREFTAAFDLDYRVRLELSDLDGHPVPADLVDRITVRNSVGATEVLRPGDEPWWRGSRVVTSFQGLREKEIFYTIESIEGSGSNLVNRSQHIIFPAQDQAPTIPLLLYEARIRVRDLFYGFPIGSAITLEFPDGTRERHDLEDGARLTLRGLPRGDYRISADAPGLRFSRPLAISRDQDVELEVLSWLDIVSVVAVLALFLCGLFLVGRRRRSNRMVRAEASTRANHPAPARRDESSGVVGVLAGSGDAEEPVGAGEEPAGMEDELVVVEDEPVGAGEEPEGADGSPAGAVSGPARVEDTPTGGGRAGSGSGSRRKWGLPRRTLALVLGVLVLFGLGTRPAAADAQSTPILAYYYIWFDPTSWNRAKVDFPALGRYSSDEGSVMRQHVQWAKQSGIDGFIVSWKHTEKLDRRLAQLIDVAEEEDFGLAVIYQGLDFERQPLPADRVATDLDFFVEEFAHRTPFEIFDEPLVVWSGTWEFSTTEVDSVASPRRDDLLLLASERRVDDYEAVADFVDGNAYYWSSVNPETFPGYEEKLSAMGEAVHARAGVWIAPVAPGFDARLIGGRTVVERADGDTLRTEWNVAMASSPDVIGLISWNEFSENTHIEPSERLGAESLEVLSDLVGAVGPAAADFDSSAPGGTSSSPRSLIALAVLAGLVFVSGLIVSRRSRSRSGDPA